MKFKIGCQSPCNYRMAKESLSAINECNKGIREGRGDSGVHSFLPPAQVICLGCKYQPWWSSSSRKKEDVASSPVETDLTFRLRHRFFLYSSRWHLAKQRFLGWSCLGNRLIQLLWYYYHKIFTLNWHLNIFPQSCESSFWCCSGVSCWLLTWLPWRILPPLSGFCRN